MRCAMTGIEIRDAGDGIWDDGEWISWAYINSQLDGQENGPGVDEEIEYLDDELDREPSSELMFRILAAKQHYEHTLDVISQDWGAIGEAYAKEKFGVELCRRKNAAGHDGRLENELVEIKTISPHKKRPYVRVKHAGNFSMLLAVLIAPAGKVEARFIPRSELPPPNNGDEYAYVDWSGMHRMRAKHWLHRDC